MHVDCRVKCKFSISLGPLRVACSLADLLVAAQVSLAPWTSQSLQLLLCFSWKPYPSPPLSALNMSVHPSKISWWCPGYLTPLQMPFPPRPSFCCHTALLQPSLFVPQSAVTVCLFLCALAGLCASSLAGFVTLTFSTACGTTRASVRICR